MGSATTTPNMNGKNTSILLGAGRSGTTLLYKLLAAHPRVAYLSNYQARLPAWPRLAALHRLPTWLPTIKHTVWFEEDGNAYSSGRRLWYRAMVPTPREAEPAYEYCGFRDRQFHVANARQSLAHYLETVRRASGASVVLTKRTANNRRIPQLARSLPQVRYIHLVRDGRAVAYSLMRVHWWKDHPLFWSGKSPGQMEAEGADPLELAARNWVEEMSDIEADLPALDPQQVHEIRYEDLLRDPLGTLANLLGFLGLDEKFPPAFRTLVETLNLKPREEAWMTRWTDAEKTRVLAIQEPALRRWGYLP